jgi:hypothetical protein
MPCFLKADQAWMAPGAFGSAGGRLGFSLGRVCKASEAAFDHCQV